MSNNIMVLGSMSGVGKSLVAAGLCRIFVRDGFSPAPFKSQNMALNSFITRDGLEMGRAQVLQAQSAGIEPEVIMNPILLKPTTDSLSQVIVHGEVYGRMSAAEYMEAKTALVPEILKSYEALCSRFSPIVIEGAGSPAEINLMEHDIVNLGLARLVDAPCILVGDIDRGGVFAQLLGTLMLLPEEDRKRIKGLVINKFRGDIALLKPGLTKLTDLSGIPVLGVLPWMELQLEEEDSLSERLQNGFQSAEAPEETLDIAVIRFPRIANFTDFDVFASVSGLTLRFVKDPGALGNPDLMILPGSKNTLSDLRWLKKTGLASRIGALAAENTPVFGICGGYQMLGGSLSDPAGVEGEKGAAEEGLSLLPADTVLGEKKTRSRVLGRIGKLEGPFSALSGMTYEGYVMHMGVTELHRKERSLGELTLSDGTVTADGAWQNLVFGTYVHGICDRADFLNALLSSVSSLRGKRWKGGSLRNYREIREEQLDRLERTMREAFSMELLYEIVGMRPL